MPTSWFRLAVAGMIGLAVGCHREEDAKTVLSVTQDNPSVEFDGRRWTRTDETSQLRPVFMHGWVYVGSSETERLVVGTDETAQGSTAKIVYQVERRFGVEWLPAGPTEVVAANGDRDLLRFWKGEFSGEQQYLRADGTCWKRVNYHLGQLHGPMQIWHDNGQIWEDHVYSNGVPIKERYYRSDGTELK